MKMKGDSLMNHTVTIKNITLGEGLPKICIPLTDPDINGLFSSIRAMSQAPFDLIEWRADCYENMTEPSVRKEAMTLLRKEFPDTPLLFTIRTVPEGGQAKLDHDSYQNILLDVIQSGLADLVDVELSQGNAVMRSLADAAHTLGVKVVASRHNFNATPPKEEIVQSLCTMQSLGADIVKYAVMPTSERDVLTLLDATLTMKEEHPDTPVITMSMGRTGAISRVSGGLFGSCLTFGTVGKASAPGQLPADVLSFIMKNLA